MTLRYRLIRSLMSTHFVRDTFKRKSKAIKLLKISEDTIESFTPAEVKTLLKQINTSRFVGFRDYVMIGVLLDTIVRISELLNIRRYNVYQSRHYYAGGAAHLDEKSTHRADINEYGKAVLTVHARARGL